MNSANVYQIKITLNDIHPPVWRRILVADKITLLDLHDTLQDVFGWVDYHLHEFTIQNTHYGDPAKDELGNLHIQDETGIRLRELNLYAGERFTYLYDFGDDWEHTLVVEKILLSEKGMKLPQCIAGKRACPPEDVGGPGGYEFFLEAIRDPQNKEHERYLEWAGGEFDPEAFDIEAANQRLHKRAKEGFWSENIPTEEDWGGHKALFDPSRSKHLLSEEGEKTAQALPLRQDVIAFLKYLQENKVVGTQSTGNLPRKAIEGIAARFVNPPKLETKFNDGTVFRFQNEWEVWPVYFVHVLAHIANLASIGPGRRWLVTPTGEAFLTLPAVEQVGTLFATWWYRVNWLVAYSLNIPGGELPLHFRKTVATLLLELPVGEPAVFETFADRIIRAHAWGRQEQETEYTLMNRRAAIEHLVINPLETFDVLSTQRESDPHGLIGIRKLVSFTMTVFGRALLESIRAGG